MTFHAEEEMNDDGLTIYDVENAIFTGDIIERQKDLNTGDWKYLIRGQAVFGDEVTVVTKFGYSGIIVIITIYLE
jgi:hypothetical protein